MRFWLIRFPKDEKSIHSLPSELYNAVPRKVALSDFKGRERVDDEENTINYYNRDYRLLLPISNGLEIVILAVISFSDFKEDYVLGDDCPFPFFFTFEIL